MNKMYTTDNGSSNGSTALLTGGSLWNRLSIKKGIKQLLVVALFLCCGMMQQSWAQTTTSFTTATNTTWTCPAGVTSITVECWGAGGGGGGTSSNPTVGSGGAGGSYSKSILTVVPGNVYQLTVGAGGTAGSNTGGNGGQGSSSYFGNTNSGNILGATCLAIGGAGGNGSTAGVAVANGSTATNVYSGTGSLTNAGGNSSAGVVSSYSGSGGGGASQTSAGGNASTSTAGTGGTGTVTGGAGAAGKTSSSAGGTGSQPGGGGSGAYRASSTSRAGGVGGAGQVNITYTCTKTYASLPYSTSFETTWTTDCATANPNDLPDAYWSSNIFNNGSTANINDYWHQNTNTTGWTSGTSGLTYITAAQAGTYWARFHQEYATNPTQGAIDLAINLSTVTGNKTLTFYYINPTTGVGTLTVQLSTDGGATFNTLTNGTLGATSQTANAWVAESFTIASNSATAVIRFLATSDYGSNDIGLDNISVFVPPVDPTFSVSSTTSSQVNFSATANANSNNIVVVSSLTNSFTTPVNGTGAPAAGNSFAGGTVVYNGAAGSITPYTTSVASNTLYYFKAFSYDGSNYFSAGVATTGTTQAIVSATTAASAITATTFSSGGTITAGGGATLTARGIATGTSSPSTTLNSSGAVATGAFTQTLIPVSPQTKYYYRAYATNAGGTTYGPESNFYSLSSPATAQPVGLSASATGSAFTMNALTTSATFPSTGATKAGYLLLYSTGTPALVGSPNGLAPSSAISVGTQIAVTETSAPTAPSIATLGVSGLPATTTYHLLIVPYTWDGTNAATYNYYTTSALTATVSTQSSVTDPATFAVTSVIATQVNFSATANANSNNIVVVYNATGTFTAPTVGTAPTAVGTTLAGSGGTIIYVGSAAGLASHTSLTSNTLYYYKAFSYDGTNTYSVGAAVNATTLAAVSATVAANSITATSFASGGTVAAGGAATLTARGVAIGTSSPSTTLNASGAVTTGAFTQTGITVLPQTKYYYRAYATNAGGTSYDPSELNFYTLASPPTANPGSFAAAGASASQINLSWTTATFPGSGANNSGYIIIGRTDGTNPASTGVTNGVAPASLGLATGTTLVTTIASGSTLSYNHTSLSSLSKYNYMIIPFTWDGTNAATYNYFVSSPATANATTNISAPWTESFTTASLPSYWSVSAGTGASVQWAVTTADATYGVAGPSSTGGTYFAFLFAEGASNSYNPYILTLNAPVTVVSGLKLNYQYYLATGNYQGTTGSTGSDPYPLEIQVSTNSGSSWTSIYSHSTSNTTFSTTTAISNWKTNSLDLSAYAGQNVMVRFLGRSNYATTIMDPAVDEISFIPPCAAPTSLAASASSSAQTTSSITASFTAASSAPTGYVVVRTATNSQPTPATGTTYSVGSNAIGYIEYSGTTVGSWTSTGLSGGTPYYYWVFSYNNTGCSGPVYSASATTFSATTVTCPSYSGTLTVGGSGTPTFPNLTTAISSLLACGYTGNIVLELQPGYTSTGETFPISFAGLATTGSKTITVRPAVGASGLTITSSSSTATIDLNGISNIIIDGSLGGNATLTVNNLTIANTSVATGGTAIRIINDAQSNFVQYCNLSATYGSATSGVINILTAVTNGNDNNTITYNNISGAGSAFNCIYAAGSTGTTAAANDNVTITYNNIYNFFNVTSSTAGIYISTGNSGWTITGNSIFNTVSTAHTTGATHYGIFVSNTSNAAGFTISGNYIGGQAANCGGTAYTIAGAVADLYRAIYISVGATLASNVQGNTIQNFSFATSSGSATAPGIFAGIHIAAGLVNVGTTTGNIIGSATGNGSITVTSTTSGGVIMGIYGTSAATITVQNNSIGSISTGGTAAIGYVFYGISLAGAGSHTVSANTIGSTSSSSSISIGVNGTTTATCSFYGIYSSATGTTESISSNNVLNCSLFTTGTQTLYGIDNAGAATTVNINSNTIGNNSSSNAAATVYGLYLNATATYNVYQNKLFNLSANIGASLVYGIYSAAATTTNIYTNIMGGFSATAGTQTAPTPSVVGIYLYAGTTHHLYFNTVYLTGSGGANFGSAALYATTTPTTIDSRDNIFENLCTPTGTGFTVAYQRSSTTLTNYATTSNNNLYYTGTPASNSLLYYDGTNSDQTITAFQTLMSSRDAASVSGAPAYLSTTGSNSSFLMTDPTVPSVSLAAGTPVTGYTQDFDGDTRDASHPDIGADEVVNKQTTIADNGSQTYSTNIVPGTSSVIIKGLTMVSTNINTLNSISFSVAGGTSSSTYYTSSDITGFKLWYGTTNSFGSATQIGTTQSSGRTSSAAETVSFSSLTQSLSTSGATNYFWLTADVANTPTSTIGHTINVQPLSSTSFAVTTGITSGTTTQTSDQIITISCSGMSSITAGTISQVATSVCPGGSTTLNLINSTAATDLTYTWHYSTDNFSTSDVTFGTNSTSVSTGTLSSTMYYKCFVACSLGSLASNVSPIVTETVYNTAVTITPSTTGGTAAATYCGYTNAPVQLTASTVGSTATGYTWSSTTGLYTNNNPASISYTGTALPTVYAAPASTTTYTVTASFAGGIGCASTTATQTVTKGTKVTISAVNKTYSPICAGTTSTLSATATGGSGYTYVWTPNDGNLSSATATSPVFTMPASPAASYTYNVTVSESGGCSASYLTGGVTTPASVTVSSTSTPLSIGAITGFTSGTSVCAGSSNITLTSAAPANGCQPYTYQWTFNGTNISGATSSTYTITPSVATGGSYTVVVKDASNNTASPSAAVNVVVPNNAFTLNNTTATYCAGGTAVTTTATPTNSGGAWSWISSPSGFTSSANNISVSPTATTTYSVTYTISGCASAAQTFVVTYAPGIASVTAFANTSSVCSGGTFGLTGNATGASYTPTLFSDGFETFPTSNFATYGSSTVTAASNTTYYSQGSKSVLLTYSTTAATLSTASTATDVYSLQNNIDLSAASSAQLTFSHICFTETGYDYGYVQYSTNGGTSWTTFPTTSYATVSGATLKNSVVSFDASSYTAWSTQYSSTSSPGTGPATSLWKTETINIPTAALTSQFRIRFQITQDGTVSYYGWLLDNIQITGVTNSTISSYAWTSSPSGYTSSTQNPTGVSLSTTGNVNTSYYVTATNNLGCSATSTAATVNIGGGTPSVSLGFTTGSATVCPGTPVTLTATVTGGCSPFTYAWTLNGVAVGTNSPTLSLSSPTYTNSGNYAVTVTDQQPIISNTATQSLTVYNTSVSITASTTGGTASNQYCGYTTNPVQLVATAGTTPDSYTWNTNMTGLYTNNPAATAYTSGTSAATVYAAPATGQTYTVTATYASLGCTSTATQAVTVGTKINNFTVTPSTTTPAAICPGGTQQLLASISAAASNYALSKTTGNSFVTITSPTVINTLAQLTVQSATAGYLTVTPSSFTFPFAGSNINTFNIGTNGYLVLGNTGSTAQPIDLSTLAGLNAIYGYGSAANMNIANSGQFQYGAGPTAGTYVFEVDKMAIANGSAASGTRYASFQIILWGSTTANPGRIDVIYANNGSGSAYYQDFAGIKDANNTILNGYDGSNSASTYISSSNGWITSGTMYTYTSPTANINYTWTDASSLLSSTSISNPTTVALSNPSTPAADSYTFPVAATNTVTGCSVTGTAQVNVQTTALTVSAPTVDNSTVCKGYFSTLTGTSKFSGGCPPYTAQWLANGVALGSPVTLPLPTTTNTLVVYPTITTNYALKITDNSGTVVTGSTVAVSMINPQPVSVTPATVCGSTLPATLSISATPQTGDNIIWYSAASNGSVLATTNAYSPSISATTTYYAADNTGGATYTGLGITYAQSVYTLPSTGINFTANTAFTLNSVTIYPYAASSTAGTVTIQLTNAAGTVLYTTANVSVTGANPAVAQVVPLGYNISAGSGYSLTYTSTGITGLIGSTASSFPYTYGGTGVYTITSSANPGVNTAQWDNFYSWSIGTGCTGTPVSVVATVTPSATITLADNSQIANQSISTNSSDNIISQGKFTVGGSNNAVLSTISAVLSASSTYANTDIGTRGFELYIGTTNNYAAATLSDSITSARTGTAAQTLTFNAAMSLTSGTTYYFWITADINSGATLNNTIIVNSLTASSFTFGGSSCNATPTGTISASGTSTIVSPCSTVAAITFGTSSYTRCTGATAPTFTGTNTNSTSQAGYTYQWYSCADASGTSPVAIVSANAVNYTPPNYTSAGSYYYYVTASCSYGSTSANSSVITVVVTATPSITVAATPSAAICIGASTTLNITGTALTYGWSPSTGLSATSGSSVTANPSVTTTYTASASNGSCSATPQTISVTVSALPTAVTATANSTTVCSGNTINLTATGGLTTNTALTETFETFPSTYFTAGSNITASSSTLFAQGAKSVNLYVSGTSVTSNNAYTLNSNVNLSTASSATLTFSQICFSEAGYDYEYVEYSTDGGTTWTSFPTSSYTGTGTLKNAVVSFDASSYSDWNSAMTSTTSIPTNTLWKSETIYIPVAALTSQFRVRFRMTTDVSNNYLGWWLDNIAINTVGNGTYSWTSTPAGFTSSTQNPTGVTPTNGIVYNVSSTNSGGCSVTNSTAAITVNSLPTAPTDNSTSRSQCGSLATFSASGTGAVSYNFYKSDGTLLGNSTTGNYSYTTAQGLVVDGTTKNYVYATVVNSGGCESGKTQIPSAGNGVVVISAPAVTVNSSSTNTCVNSVMTLNAVLGHTGDYDTYLWTMGNAGDLYSNPAGTTAYANDNIATVYHKDGSSNAGETVSVQASNSTNGCITTASISFDVNPNPVVTTATATAAGSCSGSNVTLAATAIAAASGNATIGTGTDASTLSTDGTPYRVGYGTNGVQMKNQYLILGTELQAAGLQAGNITALKLYVAGTGGGTLSNLTIKLGTTTSTALTTTYITGLTQVYTIATWPASGTLTTGLQTHTFNTAFNWDGSSNIVVEVCATLASAGSAGTLEGVATSFVSTIANNPATGACSSTTGGTTYNVRPNIILVGQVGTNLTSTYSWNWSTSGASGSSVATGASTTATSSYTGSPVVYTAIATIASTGCSGSFGASAITVNPLPVAPTATNSGTSVCGTPTFTASSNTGAASPVFAWYSASTGGTSLGSASSYIPGTYTVGANTVYVTEINAGCESSPRVSSTITASAPPALSLTTSSVTTCVNTATTLSVSVGTLGNYSTFTWSPATNLYTDAGCTSAYVSGNNYSTVYAKPSAAGAIVYTCLASGSGCSNDALVTVTGQAAPSIIAQPAPVSGCGSVSKILSVTATSTGTLTYQWQMSLNGSTSWTNAANGTPTGVTYTGGTAATLNVNTINSPYYYQVNVNDGVCSTVTSNAVLITAGTPTITASAGASSCATVLPTTENLTASASTGASLAWFTASTGGTAFATGSPYAASVSATTTYYAEPQYNTNTIFNVGYATETSANLGSISGLYGMYFATTNAVVINSVDVYPSTVGNLVITLVNGSGTTINTKTFSIVSGDISTTVKKTLSLGWSVPAGVTGYTLNYDATSTINRGTGTYTFPQTSNGFSITGETLDGDNLTSSSRWYFFNWNITTTTTCSGARSAVTATVVNAPTITVATVSPICTGSSASLGVTSSNSNYTYTWTYSDSTTILSGASQTVSPTVSRYYKVIATDNTTGQTYSGCSITGGVNVVVGQTPATLSAAVSPSIFCSGGSAVQTATGGTTTGMYILDDEFEMVSPGYTTIGTGVTATENSTYYYTGAKSVLLSYANSTSTGAYQSSQNIDLSKYSAATLKFKHICATEAGADYGYVQYSTDGGTTWTSFPTSSYTGTGTLKNAVVSFDKSSYSDWGTQFTSITSTPGSGPANSLWKIETIAIPSAAITATQFRIRFKITSNSSNVYYGWLIDDVELTGNANTVWSWTSTPTGFTSALQNPTPTPTVSTTYSVTATNIFGCASNAATDAVTILNASTQGTPAASSTLICNNGSSTSITLSQTGGVLGTGAYWSWYTSGTYSAGSLIGTTYSSDASLTISSPTVTSTYYLRAEGNQAPCNNTSGSSVTVTVNQPSSAATALTASVPTICNGSSSMLTQSGGTLGTGATWKWYSDATYSTLVGSGTGSTGSLTVYPTITTTYYVRAEGTTSPCSGNVGDNTVSVTVTVNQPSVAATSVSASTTPICNGTSITLTETGGTLGTGATWVWYSNSSYTTQVGTGNGLSVYPSATTTYYVRAEGTTSPCTLNVGNTAHNVTVTVNQPSSAATALTASVPTICNGSSSILTQSGGTLGTGATWKWYSDATYSTLVGSGTGSTGSLTVYPTTTTTYYVRAEGTTSPCSGNVGDNTVSVTVTVNQGSVAATSVSASTTPICNGTSTTLTETGGTLGTGATWVWYSNSSYTTQVGTGNGLSVYPSATTTYYVRAEGTTSPCTLNVGNTAHNVTVTVNQPSAAATSVSASNNAICTGSSSTLTQSGGTLGTGASWKWYSDNTFTTLVGTGTGSTGSIAVYPTTTTTYYVRAEGTTSPCTTIASDNTISVTVTVNQGSVAATSVSASSSTICNGSSTTLTETGGTLGTGATWVWYSDNAYTNQVGTGNGLSVSPTATTTYYVRAEGTTSPCSLNVGNTAHSVTVTVNQPSSAATSVSATNTSICTGSSSTLSQSGGTLGTGASWKWYSDNTYTTLVGSGAGINGLLSVLPTTTTSYYVRAEGTTSPCTAIAADNTLSVTVTVNQGSVAATSVTASSTAICSGTPVTLTQHGGTLGTGASWKWYSDNTYTTLIGTGDGLSVTPSATTTYYVRAEGTTAPCTLNVGDNTKSVTVNVTTAPTVSISTAGSTTICAASSVTITAAPTNGGTSPTYNFEVNGTSVQSGTSAIYTTSSLPNNGVVTVYITANNVCTTPVLSNSLTFHYATTSNNAWTGNVNTKFSTSGNWCSGTVPGTGASVSINTVTSGKYPILSANVSLSNLTLATGTSFGLGSDTLTITGSITGNGLLIGSANSGLTLSSSTANILNFRTTAAADTLIGTLKLNGTGHVQLGTGLGVTKLLSLSNAGAYLDLNGHHLTLKSTSDAATAEVGAVTSGASINGGLVTVERYIPLGLRTFRDLGPTVYGAGSIFNNWQEKGAYPTNYGMFITGSYNKVAIAGSFNSVTGADYSTTGNPSLYTFINNVWAADTLTKATMMDPFQGVRVLIRGARNYNLAQQFPAMRTATTLRATGTLVTGDVTFNASGTSSTSGATSNYGLTTGADAYSLIANPYACPIDWYSIYSHNKTNNNISSSYWYLDPTFLVSGYSVYITYNAVSGVTSNSLGSREYIQAGQGFFLQNNGTSTIPAYSGSNTTQLVISESDKAVGQPHTAVFSATKPNALAISVWKNINGTDVSVDGVVAVFRNDFTKNLGAEDSKKMYNSAENLSITESVNDLSIDGLPTPSAGDVIALKLGQVTAGNAYSLKVDVSSYTGLEAYIHDALLNSDLPATTAVSFIPTTDAATYSNRFSVVFKASKTMPVVNSGILSVYPNPVTDKVVTVQTTNIATGKYNVSLINNMGQTILATTINHLTGSATETIRMNKVLPTGVYTLLLKNSDGTGNYQSELLAK